MKIPVEKEMTLLQIVQMIIRFVTSHHAPYILFSKETVEREYRDLEKSMVLNAVGMNYIIHSLLNSLFQTISGEVANLNQYNYPKKKIDS